MNRTDNKKIGPELKILIWFNPESIEPMPICEFFSASFYGKRFMTIEMNVSI